MNRLIFDQTGGFPLKAERLQELQDIVATLNTLGHIAGEKSIISGCQVTGSETGDGTVFLNGEVLEFVGGTTQSTVVIVEESKEREFYTGDVKPVHIRRYVTFGSGQNAMDWSGFKHLTHLLELQGRILPPGTNPQLYCGSIANIPTGWQLCDGTNNTPDLRAKFIVGFNPYDSDYNEIGKTGGENKIIPNGTISREFQEFTIHKDGWGSYGDYLGSAPEGRLLVGSGDSEIKETLESVKQALHNQTILISHKHTFTGNEHENRPPYYTLAYIIYLGQ